MAQTNSAGLKDKPALNGVDTPTLLATVNLIGNEPSLGRFLLRADNRWQGGAVSRSDIHGFRGAGSEQTHKTVYTAESDNPRILCGTDAGPMPSEYLLHALAACLTTAIVNVAAAREIPLREVESSAEGDLDVQGLFGLDETIRAGFLAIRVHVRIAADAPREALQKLLERARDRSPVYDVLTRGVPVEISADLE